MHILDGILLILIIVLLFSFYKHTRMQSQTSIKLDEINRTMKYRNMELVQSEYQFKKFFTELAIPSCIFNASSLRFVHVNKRLCDILEYTESELTGMEMSEIVINNNMQESIEIASQNLKGNNFGNHVNKHLTKSKKIIEINWIYSVPDEYGNTFCIAEEIPILTKNLLKN
jgi:PAS domain S-box-containing protein